jgi:hypothetical protein
MKTPYDAALRLRQRELEGMSNAIRTEAGTLAELERAQSRMRAMLADEADLAAGDFALSSPAWLARVRGQQRDIDGRRAVSQSRIDQLRDLATDAYGILRGIETAAEGFRAERSRAEAVAEQGLVDDLGAVAFLRARREAGR